jgi:Flp pilus assembly pilin Flp
MVKFLVRLWTEESAATAVEYAVMLALILMVVLGAVMTLGQNTFASLDNTNTQLTSYGFGGGS